MLFVGLNVTLTPVSLTTVAKSLRTGCFIGRPKQTRISSHNRIELRRHRSAARAAVARTIAALDEGQKPQSPLMREAVAGRDHKTRLAFLLRRPGSVVHRFTPHRVREAALGALCRVFTAALCQAFLLVLSVKRTAPSWSAGRSADGVTPSAWGNVLGGIQ